MKPKNYVILRNLLTLERFFSVPNPDGSDPTKMADGTIGYEVLAWVDTVREAQEFLFGKDFADREEAKRSGP